MTSSRTLSNQSLLRRARQGSRSALNHLLERSRPVWLNRAERKLPRSLARKLDPEDLVQECYIEAAARFGEFRGQSLAEFCAWMRSIFDHKTLHHVRHWQRKKRDRKREESLPATGGVPDVPAGSTTSILGRLRREEDLDQLKVAAGWCRQEDRDVIWLHLYEDHSHEQIAAELGVSCDAVRQRFSRAIRRLREALRLHALMTERGIPPLKQDVIGIHQFQGVDSTTIADRLQLPEPLVVRSLEEARPLIREFTRKSDEPTATA